MLHSFGAASVATSASSVKTSDSELTQNRKPVGPWSDSFFKDVAEMAVVAATVIPALIMP